MSQKSDDAPIRFGMNEGGRVYRLRHAWLDMNRARRGREGRVDNGVYSTTKNDRMIMMCTDRDREK